MLQCTRREEDKMESKKWPVKFLQLSNDAAVDIMLCQISVGGGIFLYLTRRS